MSDLTMSDLRRDKNKLDEAIEALGEEVRTAGAAAAREPSNAVQLKIYDNLVAEKQTLIQQRGDLQVQLTSATAAAGGGGGMGMAAVGADSEWRKNMEVNMSTMQTRLGAVESLVLVGGTARGRQCKDMCKDAVRSFFPELFPSVKQQQQGASMRELLPGILATGYSRLRLCAVLQGLGWTLKTLLINFAIPLSEYSHIPDFCLSPSAAPPPCPLALSSPASAKNTTKQRQPSASSSPQPSPRTNNSSNTPTPAPAPGTPASHKSSTRANAVVHGVPNTAEARTVVTEPGSLGARTVLGDQGSSEQLESIMTGARKAKRKLCFPTELHDAAAATKAAKGVAHLDQSGELQQIEKDLHDKLLSAYKTAKRVRVSGWSTDAATRGSH